jgi:hypothetical protein
MWEKSTLALVGKLNERVSLEGKAVVGKITFKMHNINRNSIRRHGSDTWGS